MVMHLEVPPAVQRRVSARGEEGRRWLDQLDATVGRLAAAWRLEVADVLHGGSGGLVVTAVDAAGTELVLKVALPDGLYGHGEFRREREVMLLGQGHGDARVLRVDEPSRALLIERLGRTVADLGRPVEQQIDIIATTLRRGWIPLPTKCKLRTGAEQADWLHGSLEGDWVRLGRPCSLAVITVAQRCAIARRDAYDGVTAVLVHGDAHPANVLEDRTEGDRFGGFKLVDPDGLRSEPARDLAIPLRDWTSELLAGDAQGRDARGARSWPTPVAPTRRPCGSGPSWSGCRVACSCCVWGSRWDTGSFRWPSTGVTCEC